VYHSLWNHKPVQAQAPRSGPQVDEQLALHNIEKLVVLIVLMPVVLAFNHAHADYRCVHLAERLIEPLVFAGVRRPLRQ